MTTKLTFEITLNSDFHVGSGYRKGSEIDSALLRESDGRPALRGSLLGQLLRHAGRELLTTSALARPEYNRCSASSGLASLRYCRQKDPQQPECPMCHIFGSPNRPRSWEFSSAWLKEAQKPGPETTLPGGDWGAQSVTRVRINPRTRRAADDQLFIEEVGDSRLVFQFSANWNGSGDADAADVAFLVAAARNLRHLGKSRRRGRGECQVHLVAVNDQPTTSNAWLEKFKALWIDQTWQPPVEEAVHDWVSIGAITQSQTAPFRVQVVARLEEPLLVARRASAGNQFETLTIIPGSVLLGALAARTNFKDPAHYATLVHLFRRGLVRFSFLFPAKAGAGGDLYPAFVAPSDVFRCKQHPADDFAHIHPDQSFGLDTEKPVQCPACPPEDCAMESLKGENALQSLVSGRMVRFSVQKREEMHIRLNPENLRVVTGDLFSYVALEAGQFLVGELVCRDQDTWESLKREAALPDPDQAVELRLGKATRRGYGLVTVVFSPQAEDPMPPLRQRLPDPRQPFRLLLLSDTIVVDRWGRYPASFSPDWLPEALGFSADGQALKILRGFSKTRPVDGFNNQIGLPRTRDTALMAGSAVGLQVTSENMTDEQIWQMFEAVEAFGIGMRRNEGYGQVIINHPLYNELEREDEYFSVQIPVPLVLQEVPDIQDNLVIREAVFCQEWATRLEEFRNEFENIEFEAVARFLRSLSSTPIDRLSVQLGEFGKPDLKRLPGKPLLPGDPQEPYASRSNKPFFMEGVGEKGIKLIQIKIAELKRIAKTDQQRRLGVLVLADTIAEAAQRARANKEVSR